MTFFLYNLRNQIFLPNRIVIKLYVYDRLHYRSNEGEDTDGYDVIYDFTNIALNVEFINPK